MRTRRMVYSGQFQRFPSASKFAGRATDEPHSSVPFPRVSTCWNSAHDNVGNSPTRQHEIHFHLGAQLLILEFYGRISFLCCIKPIPRSRKGRFSYNLPVLGRFSMNSWRVKNCLAVDSSHRGSCRAGSSLHQ